MNPPNRCRITRLIDAPTDDFSAERRRFLKGLLPVRRHTVTITIQADGSRHALPDHAAKLAV